VLWYGAFLAISQWTALDVEYEVMEMDGSFDHPEILYLRKVSPFSRVCFSSPFKCTTCSCLRFQYLSIYHFCDTYDFLR
jgi:hypothetical protein